MFALVPKQSKRTTKFACTYPTNAIYMSSVELFSSKTFSKENLHKCSWDFAIQVCLGFVKACSGNVVGRFQWNFQAFYYHGLVWSKQFWNIAIESVLTMASVKQWRLSPISTVYKWSRMNYHENICKGLDPSLVWLVNLYLQCTNKMHPGSSR